MIVRLELAVENGMGTVENIDPNVLENMAGALFRPTAHW